VMRFLMELTSFAFVRERLEQFMPAALLDTRKEKKVAKAEWEQKIIAKYDKGTSLRYLNAFSSCMQMCVEHGFTAMHET